MEKGIKRDGDIIIYRVVDSCNYDNWLGGRDDPLQRYRKIISGYNRDIWHIIYNGRGWWRYSIGESMYKLGLHSLEEAINYAVQLYTKYKKDMCADRIDSDAIMYIVCIPGLGS